MEKKEFDQLMEQFKEEAKPFVEGLIKAKTEDVITTEKMAEELKRFVSADEVETLTKAVEKQGLEMRKMFEKNAPQKTLPELLEQSKDEIAKMKEAGSGVVKLVIPNSMIAKTDVTTSSITDHTLAFRDPSIGRPQTRRLTLADMLPVINIGAGSGGVVRYVDQTTATRSAATKAEAAAYAESAAAWTEYTLPLYKITDSIPVTAEALNDISWISGEIDYFIRTNLLLAEDTKLYSGSGSSDVKGIYTYADTYTAAASGISGANIFDLLLIMKSQCTNGTSFMPNYAMLHPDDVTQMLLSKDSNNQYIRPDFARMNADGSLNIAGMQVVESPVVTTDTCLVGDFNYGVIYRANDLVLEFGYVNDDFAKDLITLKGKIRENALVKSVNTAAFHKETGIDAALVTLAS